ncbi:E3 UFM1-protein ligase 1 like protein [Argiope bruennichi]|uniref:E3 UFM1-protein ligase 1 homolog n=1 Tax=Argiope bruennichi TaxID=94029 RepID=A0A8T0ENS0_ARGBR|nr:E3 UFM1-protein ligase 1 like protein [Argiope bruennichi]
MSAAWDEVKRLAADFQRAQLSSTVQRLSERNCIEIVKKLIESKLIDVIFTTDGKEYLTPARLLKEIRDELYVHGGRINLVDLAQIIGVDFNHVETKASEFLNSEPNTCMVLGQLITTPVPLSNIISHFKFPEKLFYRVAEDLIKEGRLAGSISGGRSERAIFIPDIYAVSQSEWINSFYKQNGYLEYDAVARLGILDPKTYLKKMFKNEGLTYLTTCCVGKSIISQIEAALDEALNSGTWVDILFYDPHFHLPLQKFIQRPLTKKYREVAKNLYDATIASTGSSRRKQHSDYQEKFSTLLGHIVMFEKAIKLFSDDVSSQLCKHLQKTLCSDLTNAVVLYLAHEHGIQGCPDSEASLALEQRQKIINKFPEEIQKPLSKLHSSLNAKSLEDFHSSIDVALGVGICDMIIRRPDKKKERLILANHRQSLLSQLNEAEDPALCLHLAALLIFQSHTHTMLHASGKFVPHIIGFLQRQLPNDLYQLLATYQESVIKKLTPNENEEEKRANETVLMETMPKIKEAAITYKKGSISESEN